MIRCISALTSDDGPLSKHFNRILNYVMSEHERAIAACKEYLPAKCLHANYPQILWIQAPNHDYFGNNQERDKFNRALEEVVKIHPNVTTLMLKKVWNPKDSNLFLEHSSRFTTTGYFHYWEAIDRTVRYFDSVMLKKHEKVKSTKNSTCQKDRFKWKNPKFNRDDCDDKPIFKPLPAPPPQKVYL